MPRAALYDPYLDTLGGGERYSLSVVESLLKLGYDVDIFWSGDPEIIPKAISRFNLNIGTANIVPDIFQEHPHQIECVETQENIAKLISRPAPHKNYLHKLTSLINKFKITRQYNIFFYLSDWSLPFLFSQKNFLHVQVPFVKPISIPESLLNYLKLLLINRVICNSKFTLGFALPKFGKKCAVLYPPVDVLQFDPQQPKENTILSVGRFDNLLNSKKQEVLIECFSKVFKQNKASDWKLVLAGGSVQDPSQNSYLIYLQSLAKDLPVEFIVNPDFELIKQTYQRSKIYWHAAGYDIDEKTHPENTEHFGIAPVEAMASGSVPIVVNKGGLAEILTDSHSGYLWDTKEDLISKTQLLIGSNSTLQKMSLAAVEMSQHFSKESFDNSFTAIINS